MDYRIENMGDVRVAGIRLSSTTENNACVREIPALWGEVMGTGRIAEITQIMNRPPFGIIGMSVYNTDKDDAKKFDYYIACATDKPAPDGMAEYTIPAATWAVFPCKRADMHDVEARVVTQWQPASAYALLNTGYETGNIQAGAPDLEIYPDRDDPEKAEVWVAVREK